MKFNLRTNTHKNISLTLYSRKGDVSSPKFFLIIAALLPHLGWVAQPWVTEGPKPSVCRWLSIRHLVSNWLQLPRTQAVCVLAIYLYWRPPASAVLPLIYTGASLDWRLGQGSVCCRRLRFVRGWGHKEIPIIYLGSFWLVIGVKKIIVSSVFILLLNHIGLIFNE